jgi:3alpha(or 20beta)-hydroxysteroid dehydrogenase
MGRQHGRTALVTIGPCTAAGTAVSSAVTRALHADGAHVVICDREPTPGKELAAELGERAEFADLDVSREDDWRRVVERVTAELGPIDVLVSCARTRGAQAEDTTELSLDEYLRVVAVNQTGVFLGMRAVLPGMIAAGHGSIVNLASIDGLRGVPGWSAYCAANHAVAGLTRSTALEVAIHGVRVNMVCAGPSKAIAAELDESDLGALASSVPMGRLADPAEVASVVAFLASDDSSCCTGATIAADLGRLAGPARPSVIGARL